MHTPVEGMHDMRMQGRERLYQSCSKNCEISNYGFLTVFVFLFINVGPHGSKNTTFPLKIRTRFALQNSCIRLGRVSAKVVEK